MHQICCLWFASVRHQGSRVFNVYIKTTIERHEIPRVNVRTSVTVYPKTKFTPWLSLNISFPYQSKSVNEPVSQYKKKGSTLQVISPERTSINVRNESHVVRDSVSKSNIQLYKANPLIAETQRRTTENQRKKAEDDSIVVNTSQLSYSYRTAEKPAETKWRSSDPSNESSNVLLARQSSNVGYSKRWRNQNQRKNNQMQSQTANLQRELINTHAIQRDAPTDAEPLKTFSEVPYNNLRAKLRKTGNIEQTSGLHKMELARQHTQRVINVK